MYKRAVKGATRPVTRRFFFWTDKHIEHAVTPLYESAAGLGTRVESGERRLAAHDQEMVEAYRRLDRLEAVLGGLENSLPPILSALSTQNAWARNAERRSASLAQETQVVRERLGEVSQESQQTRAQVEEVGRSLDQLWGRVEFVRRELAFEMRHSGVTTPTSHQVTPRVLNPSKVEEQGNKIRVNLGCGHLALEEYVNIDMRELPGVDVVAEVHDLPFSQEDLFEIHSAHMLEHFPVEDLRRRLLPYLYGLLCDGGTFSAVVPDAETMLAEHAAGRYSFEELRLVTFGEQEYEGDFHFTMFSQHELQDLLEGAGFLDVTFPVVGRRNGACYEMQVLARKATSGAVGT